MFSILPENFKELSADEKFVWMFALLLANTRVSSAELAKKLFPVQELPQGAYAFVDYSKALWS